MPNKLQVDRELAVTELVDEVEYLMGRRLQEFPPTVFAPLNALRMDKHIGAKDLRFVKMLLTAVEDERKKF